jgi:hypothetical protein
LPLPPTREEELFEVMTLDNLKAEFRMTGDGDDWGNCLQWWFIVAEEIALHRDVAIPDSWEYQQGLGEQNDPDDYRTEIVRDATDAQLLAFGALLMRYARVLKHAGKDY